MNMYYCNLPRADIMRWMEGDDRLIKSDSELEEGMDVISRTGNMQYDLKVSEILSDEEQLSEYGRT